MRFLLLFIILSFVAPCFAQGPEKVSLPIEVRQEMVVSKTDPSIQGKQWNRWTSKNFVVCSINDVQAQFLYNHLEVVKAWVFSRWGLYDIDFGSECKLICIDDPTLFKKLFNMDTTKVEVRRDTNGKIKETVIFLLLNDSPSKTVPVPLTEVCLAEFEQKYNANWGWWIYRGMTVLNSPIDQIRRDLLDLKPLLDQNTPMYFSQNLLTMTKDQWKAEAPQRQQIFDRNAAALCLMLRKEFGQDKFHKFLVAVSGGKGEAALREAYGFQGYAQFDSSFKGYMTDLCNDLASGRTPDHYLQIREKQQQ